MFWESIGKLSASVALAAWASSVTAQENDWEFTASLYLFTPKTTTKIGALDSTLTFKDALENLDLGKKAWMHSPGDKVTEENTKGARTVFGSSVGVFNILAV